MGSAYEILKVKFANLAEKIKNGASATFSDSEDEEIDPEIDAVEENKEKEAHQDDYEKEKKEDKGGHRERSPREGRPLCHFRIVK